MEKLMQDNIFNDLQQISPSVREQEPMAAHTTFRVGGPADFYAEPADFKALKGLLRYCKEKHLDYYILGNGSNLLVRDKGYRGLIINLSALNMVYTKGERVFAQCGALLKTVANRALEAALSGLEFASGIPGTVGGGVRMNAGAYDGELENVIESVTVLDENGELRELQAADCEFAYRHSIIQDKPWIILEAVMHLTPGDAQAIDAKMRDLNGRRADKQPLNFPSAGSTFRRPEGFYAGKLIQDIGYKGKRVGGAQVSEKHSGFVINAGGATAADVIELITQIQNEVRAQFGVEMKTEVIIIGE